MLSILCVRLMIKVKVGIPESFKVGWYPPKKTGSSHLKEQPSTFLDCEQSLIFFFKAFSVPNALTPSANSTDLKKKGGLLAVYDFLDSNRDPSPVTLMPTHIHHMVFEFHT